MIELSREDVRSVVERRGMKRVPAHFLNYLNDQTVKKYSKEKLDELLNRYPCDVIDYRYPWSDWNVLADANSQNHETKGIDARIIIEDYRKLKENIIKISKLADIRDAEMLEPASNRRKEFERKYCLGYTWFGIFERLWMLHGMENTLIDFYENPEEVKALINALKDYHLRAIEIYGKLGYDGIAISDDLGGQINTIFSNKVFKEFFKPYYKEMFDCAHSFGMNVWMHSCGHVTPLIDDLIEAGLDILHPIQYSTHPKGTSANDIREIAVRFKGRISFWAGIDVQYLLPLGSPEEVREGVRELMDVLGDPNGGIVLAAGNGIMPETPFENIEAFYNEVYVYGSKAFRK